MKFSIREVLWLTVVAAVGVGWWVNRRDWIHQYQNMEEKIAAERHEARKREFVLQENLKTRKTEANFLQIMLNSSKAREKELDDALRANWERIEIVEKQSQATLQAGK